MKTVWVVDAETMNSWDELPSGNTEIASIHETKGGANAAMHRLKREHIAEILFSYDLNKDKNFYTSFYNGEYDVNEVFECIDQRYKPKLLKNISKDGAVFEDTIYDTFSEKLPSVSIREYNLRD